MRNVRGGWEEAVKGMLRFPSLVIFWPRQDTFLGGTGSSHNGLSWMQRKWRGSSSQRWTKEETNFLIRSLKRVKPQQSSPLRRSLVNLCLSSQTRSQNGGWRQSCAGKDRWTAKVFMSNFCGLVTLLQSLMLPARRCFTDTQGWINSLTPPATPRSKPPP